MEAGRQSAVNTQSAATDTLEDLYYRFEITQPEYELPLGAAITAPGPNLARDNSLHAALANVADLLQNSLEQKVEDSVQKAVIEREGHDPL